jgi:nitric oxide synthase oxygenase domain/subunit
MITPPTHQDQSSKMGKLELPCIVDSDHRSDEEILNDASLMLRGIGMSDEQQKVRLEEIRAELQSNGGGSYIHTLQELEKGSRLAWKLSSRCIMRAASNTLSIRDCRDCITPAHMFDVLVRHLRECQHEGIIEAMITIFPPKKAGRRGFRV